MFTRRSFLVASAAAAGAARARAAAAASPRPARAAAPRLGPFTDAHVHVGTIRAGETERLTVDDLLREMDARNVAQAWVHPLVSPEAFPHPVATEYVLDVTRRHRDRLVPFCAIDPRNSWFGAGKAKAMRRQLLRYLDAGAKGFGEHKVGLPIDDPRNMELYAACAELRLPVLLHIDARRNMDAPGLPGLEKVLSAFPETPWIGHAHGFWANISGDVTADEMGKYPKKPIAPGGALDRLFDRHPNLYGDLSSGSGMNALTRDPSFTRPFLIRRADRLLFGTDFLKKGWDTGQYELFERIELPADVRRRIFRDNARRLVG